MKSALLQLVLIGCCLSACQLQAREVSSSPPPEQSRTEALQTEFEQEMKTQLAQKNIDDYSFNEISDIALKASKKVYGAHPQLMKQKALFDLERLPQLDSQVLGGYRVKETLTLSELQREMFRFSSPKAEENYEDFLPLFYGRKPEQIAMVLKQMIHARHIGPKQLGQRAMITQFIPDKTYQIKASDPPQLAVKTFNDHLFLVTVQVTEAGLLKPLKVEWMQPKKTNTQSS